MEIPELHSLNLTDYFEIFLRRKYLILTIFCMVFLYFFINTNLKTPQYQASLTFKVEELNVPMPVEYIQGARRQSYPSLKADLADYVRGILSGSVRAMAIEEYAKSGVELTEAEKKSVAGRFSVSADQIGTTNMIRLTVKSDNPNITADIANLLFNIFKQKNFDEKNRQRRDVTVFIEKTLNDVAKKLKEEEDRLRDLTTQGAVGTADGLVQQISELEKKKVELLSIFTENYPEVLALTDQMNELRATLKTLPQEEFEHARLVRDIGVDQALYTSLKKKLQESQIESAEKVDNVILVDAASVPRRPYYPNKKQSYSQGILFGIIFSLAAAYLFEQVVETSIGKVEDLEGMLKVSIVGVIPFYSQKKEHTAGKGFFSKPSKKDYLERLKTNLLIRQNEGSIFMEAFRILAANTQVAFGLTERIKNKIILVTSSNPNEGKSLISSNLSIILAQMGYNTLLIDGDLRKPCINIVFGIKKETKGFTDVLNGSCKLEDIPGSVIKNATDLMLGDLGSESILKRPWLNNLNILTSGSVTPNPVHLFASNRLSDTLKYLKNIYDVIIVDTPPLLLVSDTALLMPKVDGVLLAYSAGQTSRFTLRRSKTRVEKIKGKGALNGLILNNVVHKLSLDTYYHYYHKDYYLKGLDKSKKSTQDPERV